VIELALDEGTLALTASWAHEALVQIVSPSGQVRGAVVDTRDARSGPQVRRFLLRTGAESFTNLLVVPGDVVEMRSRAEVFRIEVPSFDVRIDPAADVITGTFPSAAIVDVGVWDARVPYPDRFDAEVLTEQLPVVDGHIRLDLDRRYDVRPGTGVTLTFGDADGNRFIANRTVPSVDIRQGAFAVRADPGSEPRLVVTSGDQAVWNSGPMIWSGALDYAGTPEPTATATATRIAWPTRTPRQGGSATATGTGGTGGTDGRGVWLPYVLVGGW